MTISFVAASAAAGQVNSKVTLTVPASVQAGDLLLGVFVYGSGNGSTSAPTASGWSLFCFGQTNPCIYVLTRTAVAADAGASFAFSTSASTPDTGVIVAYRGTYSTPAKDICTTSGQIVNATTVTAPTVTTSDPNELVLEVWGNLFSAPQIVNMPATKRVLSSISGGNQIGISDQTQATAGQSTAQSADAGVPTTNKLDATTLTIALKSNNPPNAPAVQVSSTIDSGSSNVISAPFSDPDAGDTCSQTDFQWWDLDSNNARVGAAHTQTVAGAQPTQWAAPAGTFTNGNKEIQAKSYDALGVASAWGPSAFFTAATPTGMPTITDPTNGATISSTPYTVAWTTAGGQKGYQVRRVKDNAGAADATTVYWNSGQVTDANARSLSVPFETNNRYEHVQVSVTADGTLWSSWADARVNVSYTAPAAPTFSVDLDAVSGSALVTITSPAPGTGQPSVAYNVVETDDGDGKGFSTRPGSSQVTPNTSWRYWTPPSGFDPAAHVRVTAVGTNGVTSSTTSPVNVTSGGTPGAPAAVIYDGGTP